MKRPMSWWHWCAPVEVLRWNRSEGNMGTLPETKHFAPEIQWLKDDIFFWGRPIFRGDLLVSGRSKLLKHMKPIALRKLKDLPKFPESSWGYYFLFIWAFCWLSPLENNRLMKDTGLCFFFTRDWRWNTWKQVNHPQNHVFSFCGFGLSSRTFHKTS